MVAREAEATRTFIELEEEVQRLKLLASVHSTIVKRRVAAHWGGLLNVGVKHAEDGTKHLRKHVHGGQGTSRPIADDVVEEEVKLSPHEIRSRLKAMKLAFSEFYLSLVLLQQYQVSHCCWRDVCLNTLLRLMYWMDAFRDTVDSYTLERCISQLSTT